MVHWDERLVIFFQVWWWSIQERKKKKPFLKLKVLVDRTHPKIEFYSSSYAQRTHSLPCPLVFFTDPTSCYRWAQQTLHVDTWVKIIQHIRKIHQGLAINKEALGVTSCNLQTLIALRPPGWTKKGIPLHHTHENFWLEWGRLVFPLLQGCDQFLAPKSRRDVGIWWEWQRPGI